MKKILVIDDDEDFLGMLKCMLEREGYTVITADNGRDGNSKFQQEGPDIVITDIVMPEQEGIETIKMLRRQSKDVPIIAISGGGVARMELYLKLAVGLGATKTFYKPFERDDFLEAVSGCLI